MPNENGGEKGWSCGMSVSLLSLDVWVLGGGLVGILVVVGFVQVRNYLYFFISLKWK